MSIYLGRHSVMCKREKICVVGDKKKGITSCQEAKAIIKLIFRDLKRGWTYNQQGKKIRMTKELAKKRIEFIKKLARFHRAPKKELKCIDKEVERALKKLKFKV